MRYKQGTAVYNASGDDVGTIDRVVIDPRTNEVTYLVVRKGVLFTEDKVVPVSLVASAKDDGVVLNNNAGNLDELPAFEETYYVPVEEAEPAKRAEATTESPSLYMYPPLGGPLTYTPAGYNPGFIAQTTTNIPENDVALKNGANIISEDGQHVGDVAEIITGAQSERATHIVISQGLLFKSHKLIPMDWVRDMDENEIHVAVTAQTLKSLPDYEPNPR